MTCFLSSNAIDESAERARVEGADVAENASSGSSYHHELLHWFQFQATSIGQFLLALQHARNQVIARAAIRDGRFAHWFTAPTGGARIPYFADHPAEATPSDLGPDSRRALDRFVALENIRRFVFHSPTLPNDTFAIADAFAHSLHQVDLVERLRIGDPENVPALPDVAVPDARAWLLPATVFAIMEVAALCGDLSMMMARSESVSKKTIDAVIRRLTEESYSTRCNSLGAVLVHCISVLNRGLQADDLNAVLCHLFAVSMACDIALNPRVPPNDPLERAYDAGMLHPGARMGSMIPVLDDTTWWRPARFERESFAALRAGLLQRSELTASTRAPRPMAAGPADVLSRPADVISLPRQHWHWLRESSARVHRIREQVPEVLVAYPLMLNARYEVDLVGTYLFGIDEEWLHPPGLIYADGLRMSFADPELGLRYIESLVADYACRAWAFRGERGGYFVFPSELDGDIESISSQYRGHVVGLAAMRAGGAGGADPASFA